MGIHIIMKHLKSQFQALTAALTLGTLMLGMAPVTTLASTYDATAEFTFTLSDVVDADGNRITCGWDVFGLGDGDVLLSESGIATADGSVNVIDPVVYLGIGDSITQTSSSSGQASNGFAATDALTDLEIQFENYWGDSLIFSFEYDIYLYTDTTGDAEAHAYVDMLDDLGFFDVQAFSDVLSGPANGDADNNMLNLHGEIEFELMGDDFNMISGFVDTYGSAAAEHTANVPEPISLLLMATGLVGVGFASRKKRTI